MSMLDEIQLNKEMFESCIAVGRKIPDICTFFSVTRQELEKWAQESYGMPLQTVYDKLHQYVIWEYTNAMKDLGYRGNPTALHIIDEVLRDNAAQSKVVKIVFDNAVPLENEKDKENDD